MPSSRKSARRGPSTTRRAVPRRTRGARTSRATRCRRRSRTPRPGGRTSTAPRRPRSSWASAAPSAFDRPRRRTAASRARGACHAPHTTATFVKPSFAAWRMPRRIAASRWRVRLSSSGTAPRTAVIASETAANRSPGSRRDSTSRSQKPFAVLLARGLGELGQRVVADELGFEVGPLPCFASASAARSRRLRRRRLRPSDARTPPWRPPSGRRPRDR